MRLEQVLFSQGFGSRHECRALILLGRVQFERQIVTDPDLEIDPVGKTFCVDNESWPYYDKAIVALYKPTGYECSQKPTHHPSVMTLLPAPLRVRGIQPVGRLDEDTTGLLLLTDDGALIHRLTHPKKHVSKTYVVTLKHESTEAICERLKEGVLLADEKEVVKATEAYLESEKTLVMTITSGKYHQVKRMVAAAGNRVEKLHRQAFGKYELDSSMKPGQWAWIADSKKIY